MGALCLCARVRVWVNERARNVTIYKVKFDIIIFDESKYLMCSYQMMCGVVGNVAQNYSHFLIVRSHAFFRVLFFSVNRHAYVNFHIGHNLLFTSLEQHLFLCWTFWAPAYDIYVWFHQPSGGFCHIQRIFTSCGWNGVCASFEKNVTVNTHHYATSNSKTQPIRMVFA